MKKNWFLLYLILVLCLVGCGGGSKSPKEIIIPADPLIPTETTPLHTYYVSPDGNDVNPGTSDKPFKSWSKAWSVVVPGDLVYVRGGTYTPDTEKSCDVVLKGKSGSPGKYIRFFAYPGETPILDCSKVTVNTNIYGIYFVGNYCHFKGLEIQYVPQKKQDNGQGWAGIGFKVENSSNNIFENIRSHHNGGSGFNMCGDSNQNLIINCDFYYNYDPYTYNSNGNPYPGGNADGIAMHDIPKGNSNFVTGCRFWWNSDDGIDLWENEGTVVIHNCWSFKNGYIPGTSTHVADGTGYKLGRTTETAVQSPRRFLYNCVAYGNWGSGVAQNGANVLMVFYNNTIYKNGGYAFFLPDPTSILKNNISYNNFQNIPERTIEYKIPENTVNLNNSWNGFSVSDADFISISDTGIDGSRMSDGSLPKLNFMRLKSSSSLVNSGVDVKISFSGQAPDIGAFESE